jgi:D-glycero-D-manno-heptose 1,7-bisphosphate phosphatase
MTSKPCVFLDRDGVINYRAKPGAYVTAWEQFRLIPDAEDWIRVCNSLEYLVIVVTNQRCVARGLMTQAELTEMHRKMCLELASRGAHVDDVFVCPHEIGTCRCRKPEIGLVLQAQAKWDIRLTASIMIGDSDSDEELARRCDMRFIRVLDGVMMCETEKVIELLRITRGHEEVGSRLSSKKVLRERSIGVAANAIGAAMPKSVK